MRWRNLVILFFAVAAMAGAYALGRWHDDAAPNVVAAPEEAPAPDARPAAGEVASGEDAATRAPHALPGDFMHFELPNSNIKALVVDGKTVWLGTSIGVIKYDTESQEHTIYNNKNGLLSNGVFHLAKRADELWVGTYGGGLSVLDTMTGQWRNYNVPDGMGDAFVYDTLVTRNGDIWIATWSGANRIVGGKMEGIRNWELFTVENTDGGLPNDWVYGLAEGKNGEIWMATEGGLTRYVDGEWTSWSHADGVGAPYETVKADIPFRNDPAKLSGHHATQKEDQGLGDVDIAYNPNYIVSLVVDGAGRVWTGTWGAGLSVFDGRGWKTFTSKDGLPANHIFMLQLDERGRLWIGTSHGLARYDGLRFLPFRRKDGLFSDTVFSMAFGSDGEAWVGSYGGVARFPGGLDHASD